MTSVTRLKDSRIAAAVLISSIIFLVIVGLRRDGRLEALELAAFDWFIIIQPKLNAPNTRITLVRITDDDIHDLGKWPLTDGMLAGVMKSLLSHEPRAIGIDIFRDVPVPPGTDELDRVLLDNPHIVAVMKFGDGGLPAPAVLLNTEKVGFNDVLVDAAGTIRRALLFLDDGVTSCASLAYRLAVLFFRREGIVPRGDATNPELLRLGPNTIKPLLADDGPYVHADDRGYQFLLDFRDDPHSFPSVTLKELLSGKVDDHAIRNRIVLLGVAAHGVKDFFFTPYSRSLPPDEQVSGIQVHAHAVSQLLRLGLGESSPTRTLPPACEDLWILLSCMIGGTVALGVHAPWRFASLLLSGVLVFGGIAFSAFHNGWWIPVVPPWLGWAGSASLSTAYTLSRERRQRSILMQIFSRHVSPMLAETIWRQREQFMDGGRPRSQKLVATTLFSDLQGFTPVVEKMDPLVLTEWLNTYMESMAQLVMDFGGVVDDYAGDGIKANFGVPIPRTSEEEIRKDAANAVKCALAMADRMEGLNSEWQERLLPTARLRVGISTGTVVATTIGSAQRLKYTTIGNDVNIAARLEGYDKLSMDAWMTGRPCRVLLSESTVKHVEDDFQVQQIGEVFLKGQERGIIVYFLKGPDHVETEGPGGEERR